MRLEVELTEEQLNLLIFSTEPYHGGTEPLMRIRILEKLGVAGGERLGEKNNNIV